MSVLRQIKQLHAPAGTCQWHPVLGHETPNHAQIKCTKGTLERAMLSVVPCRLGANGQSFFR